MKLELLTASAILLAATIPVAAADSPQFRGPDRNGVFPAKDLAKSWPDEGPKQLWSVAGLGESYSSMAVAEGKIFTAGKHGDQGTAYAFDLQGKKLWSTVYGTEHSGAGYPGSRTTPTYSNGAVFLLSSNGEAVALDASTGEVRWKVNVLERFGGENIQWGVSESPLVDGDRVIFTPGGKDASIVALETETGKTVWTSKGLSDSAAYCNPRIWTTGKHRQLVTMTAGHLVGLDPETGELLWQTEVTAAYDIHANSPVFDGDLVYISHHVVGGQAFRLSADGRSVSPVWTDDKLDIHHGGAVLVGGHIYGGSLNDGWFALDVATGEMVAALPELDKGAVVFADGRLYAYLVSGEMLLIDPKSFEVISRFTVTAGEGQHWSHPVIVGQVLYLRHGDTMMAYDIAPSGKPAAGKASSGKSAASL